MRNPENVRVFDNYSYIEYIDKALEEGGHRVGSVYENIEKDVKSGKIVVRPFEFLNHLVLDWRTELILTKDHLVIRDPITQHVRRVAKDFKMYLDVCPNEEWRDLVRLSVLCSAVRNQRSCEAMRRLLSRNPAVLYAVVAASRDACLEQGACKAGAKEMLNLVRVGVPNEENFTILPMINAKKKLWLGDASITDRRVAMLSDNNEFGVHIRFPDNLSVLAKAKLTVALLPLLYCLCGLYMINGDIFSIGAASTPQMSRGFTMFEQIDSYVAYFFEVDEDMLYPYKDDDDCVFGPMTQDQRKSLGVMMHEEPAFLNAFSDVHEDIEERNNH